MRSAADGARRPDGLGGRPGPSPRGSAKQAAHDYTAAHLDEIVRALEPEAEARRAEVVRVMGELAAAASAYLGLAGRVNALKGTVRERQHERVPAYDVGSDLLKLSRDYEPPPLPAEIR